MTPAPRAPAPRPPAPTAPTAPPSPSLMPPRLEAIFRRLALLSATTWSVHRLDWMLALLGLDAGSAKEDRSAESRVLRRDLLQSRLSRRELPRAVDAPIDTVIEPCPPPAPRHPTWRLWHVIGTLALTRNGVNVRVVRRLRPSLGEAAPSGSTRSAPLAACLWPARWARRWGPGEARRSTCPGAGA
jgi:hypothetical protein